MTGRSKGVAELLSDIAPFFYRRRMVYVDVGAFDGEECEKVLSSGMDIGEAHLIEPNPGALKAARERITKGEFRRTTVHYYQLALGAKAGRVRLRSARAMTKVIGDASEDADSVTRAVSFDAECATLDQLSKNFLERRISLLKIDVEGYELEVLAGAEELLRDQRIDMLYVEAGMSAGNEQQTYYRSIEDTLAKYGYRLFRIYEQQNEWINDSPFLRRVNLAFISERFAQSNPLRLTRELYQSSQELARTRQELEAANRRVEELQRARDESGAEVQALKARLRDVELKANALEREAVEAQGALERAENAAREAGSTIESLVSDLELAQRRARELQCRCDELSEQLEIAVQEAEKARKGARREAAAHREVAKERDALKKRIVSLQASAVELKKGRDALRAKCDDLAREIEEREKKLRNGAQAYEELRSAVNQILEAVAQLQRRELRAWSEAARAKAESDSLREGIAYRLGQIVVDYAKSPAGWLRMPAVLLRAYSKLRASAENAPSSAAPVDRPISFHGDRSIFVPLTLRSVKVALPVSSEDRELWLQLLTADREPAVAMELSTSGAQDRVQLHVPSKRGRSRPGRAGHRVSLRGKQPIRIAAVRHGSESVTLELRRTHGRFCVLKLELLRPEVSRIPGKGNAPQQLGYGSDRGHAKSLADASDLRKNPTAVRTGGTPPSAAAGTDAQAVQSEATEGSPIDQGSKRFTAADLEKKLWGGFARYAIPELERLRDDPFASLIERVEAAWYLSRWFYVEGDYARALENVRFASAHSEAPEKRFLILEIQLLLGLGRAEEAEELVNHAIRLKLSKRPDFLLLRSTAVRRVLEARGASAVEVEAAQIQALNEHFTRVRMAPIAKKDPSLPLSISNLTADAQPRSRVQPLKVSVIMPAFNCESTIEWAIESLLRQTWVNLEIIVVDDLSTDRTCERVEQIAARDSRVRLVRKTKNEGAYPARNTGLKHAAGDFITVHDADDWSHPQKIELQVEALEGHPERVAVLSYWVRVKENLEIVGAWLPKGSIYDVNLSSLMFRRHILENTHPWDDVRVSADAEFHSRLVAIYGEKAVYKLPQDYLLSFSLVRDNSLTRSETTHLRSLFHGVRRNYRDAYRYWHELITSANAGTAPADGKRFPIPLGNRPDGAGKHRYDMVVVSDFALFGGAFVSTLHYILAARRLGKRVAVFHWRKYDLSAYTPPNPRLYKACLEHDVDILSPGDSVETELVLVGYPPILQHRIDPMPTISTRKVVVVVNQFASRLVSGADQQYDPRVVRRNLADIFGTEGIWVPISAWVQRLMREDSRYPTPHQMPWLPMIDAEAWCKSVPRWRGSERKTPVIGRHGRDAYTKWPSSPEAIRHAYCVDTSWEVRFLGGAQHAVQLLGGYPTNWKILPFDGMSVQDFLADLDFFIHYPHEEYIEEFGRAVMEAMAVGVPVVLPHQFKETFGDAALYAAPHEVVPTIARLWESKADYLKRIEIGRRFVAENCDIRSFDRRLAALEMGTGAVDATGSLRVA